MSYLGFHPGRVDLLRRATIAARNELHGISLSDAAAADAAFLVRRAIGQLTDADTRFARILNDTCMSTIRDVRLDKSDLTQSFMYRLRTTYGWTVIDDAPGRPIYNKDEYLAFARELGVTLRGDVGKLLGSEEELDYLTTVLEHIGGDPSLSDDFIRNLGVDGLAHLCDALAARRAEVLASDHPSAPVDSALGGLGGILTRLTAAQRDHVLETTDPATAAILLRSLNVSDEELAQLAVQILRRQAELHQTGHQTLSGSSAYEQLGDILFPILTRRPAAASMVLSEVEPDEVLLAVADLHSDVVGSLYRAGTQPAPDGSSGATAAQASERAKSIIVALLDFMTDAENAWPADEALVDARWLGELLGPWVLDLRDPDSWNLSSTDFDRYLDLVADHADAAGALAAGLASSLPSVQRALDRGLTDAEALTMLDRMMELLGFLHSHSVISTMKASEEAAFWSNVMFFVVGVGLAAVGGPAWLGVLETVGGFGLQTALSGDDGSEQVLAMLRQQEQMKIALVLGLLAAIAAQMGLPAPPSMRSVYGTVPLSEVDAAAAMLRDSVAEWYDDIRRAPHQPWGDTEDLIVHLMGIVDKVLNAYDAGRHGGANSADH